MVTSEGRNAESVGFDAAREREGLVVGNVQRAAIWEEDACNWEVE